MMPVIPAKKQVLDPVIISLSVDVVDHLAGHYLPPKVLLNHQHMLEPPPTSTLGHLYAYVAIDIFPFRPDGHTLSLGLPRTFLSLGNGLSVRLCSL